MGIHRGTMGESEDPEAYEELLTGMPGAEDDDLFKAFLKCSSASAS
jgi:hypothetical protein